MQYVLTPQFRDTTPVTVEVGDIQHRCGYPVPSGETLSPDPEISTQTLPGLLDGREVSVKLRLGLRNYYFQMQVDHHAWGPVEETPDALRLRAHLLRLLLTGWQMLRETDPLGPEAYQVAHQARGEIQRIEALSP